MFLRSIGPALAPFSLVRIGIRILLPKCMRLESKANFSICNHVAFGLQLMCTSKAIVPKCQSPEQAKLVPRLIANEAAS